MHAEKTQDWPLSGLHRNSSQWGILRHCVQHHAFPQENFCRDTLFGVPVAHTHTRSPFVAEVG
jgi:hypothetical protein